MSGFVLMPVFNALLDRRVLALNLRRLWPWIGLVAAIAILGITLVNYPITIWDHEVYAESPITYSLALNQGLLTMPEAVPFDKIGPVASLLGLFLGGVLLSFSIAGFMHRKQTTTQKTPIQIRQVVVAIAFFVVAVVVFLANDWLTETLMNMSTTWRFFVAMGVAAVSGLILGGIVESTLIRPLYDRPYYQIMLTFGIAFIIIEMVRSLWGRPEFTMPKPAFVGNSGEGCPAESIGGWLTNSCSTIFLFDGRVRTYNEIFIILVGILVLVVIWLLMQRTRLGMIVRAGVQDSEMVEALGINVRRVFTLIFSLGVGLAALGGVLAAPSIGLGNDMGSRFLLLSLIALAIGGLTSFPGAAVGALLVGLMQQFITKYGEIGINLPFLEEPFKPSPPLVPASVVLLMVIILLILPNGLFGRSE
jgi:branched-chain amino acid transport system permease protein